MFRGLFKLYLLRQLFGGRGGGGRRGCGGGIGCFGVIIFLVLIFFLVRGCGGGGAGWTF